MVKITMYSLSTSSWTYGPMGSSLRQPNAYNHDPTIQEDNRNFRSLTQVYWAHTNDSDPTRIGDRS